MKAPLQSEVALVSTDIEAVEEEEHVHEAGREEDDGVDQPNDPFVSALAGNAKFLGKGQVGAIGTGLIPSLGRRPDGTEADRVPQHKGPMPLVVSLVLQGAALFLVEFRNHLEPLRIAGHQGGAAKERGVLRHAVCLGKGPGIADVVVF